MLNVVGESADRWGMRLSREPTTMSPPAAPAGSERTAPGRLTVVCSAKGGEGSTTIALGLATSAAGSGQKTVVVDGDPLFGDIGITLGIEARVGGSAAPEDELHDVGPHLRAWLPPQQHDLSAAKADTGAVLAFVSTLQMQADQVIVDAPPMRAARLELLGVADELLLITRSSLGDLKNAMIAIQVMHHAGIAVDQVQVVVNGHDPDHDPPAKEIGRALGVTVRAVIPERGSAEWEERMTALAADVCRPS